ncbi:MAG TPA: bis(5'-nucleosyl)-tetraphosphatase (symmetrical) YqeK [Syntrophomonadaceae bacterium]|jgi:predicted HD superfamily hydrolase involved in NAD metabolism|nr:HD domain-containing protein [Syntrophomonadaceae bacterium]HOQ09326.1 bis(5'-nucleosyl)-tetraphosphatase (symmetrical) YqeK [Syntrophomonadaceae bacterium]
MKYSDEDIIEIIRKRLSANRFQHSLQVAETARRLAELHRVDPGQAYTTGLLHDYAKGLSGQQLLDIAEIQGLISHPVDRLVPDLLHGPVGAYLVQEELGLRDPQMLAAIANHTLGALDMSPLEEIIFLADMIEPGRDYPGLERLQCLTERSLEQGMLFGLESTIRYCIDQGRIIHPRSIEVRNHYLQKCSAVEGC